MAKFKTGQKKPSRSGRRKGVKNRTTREIGELSRDLLNDVYFGEFRLRLLNGMLPPQLEVLVWHYAFGRPVERLEVKSDLDPRLSLEQFRSLAGIGYDDDPEPPPKSTKRKKTKALARH